METKTLGILIALSIVLIISGAYLASYTEIGTQTISGIPIPTITKPYNLIGNILLVVGIIMLIISAALLVGTLLIREAKAPAVEAPKVKAKKRKIAKVVEEVEVRDYTSRFLTDIIFGIVFIVIGFLVKYLMANVIVNESTDSGTIISIGNWALNVFVVIGMLIIGYGIAHYIIAKKRE